MADRQTSKSGPLALGMLAIVTAFLWFGGRDIPAQPPDASPSPVPTVEETAEEAVPVQPDDPRLTAGGALRQFMVSRDYRTIKQLKGVLTEKLQARFDHDSAPFNGKRGNRLAAFDFSEKDLRARASQAKSQGSPSTYVGS